jgi:hypothetical protein
MALLRKWSTVCLNKTTKRSTQSIPSPEKIKKQIFLRANRMKSCRSNESKQRVFGHLISRKSDYKSIDFSSQKEALQPKVKYQQLSLHQKRRK